MPQSQQSQPRPFRSSMQPPPKKPRSRRYMLIAAGLLALVVLFAWIANTHASQQSAASLQTRATHAFHVISPTIVNLGATPTRAKPTPYSTKPAITHGQPGIGGPISDFFGKYGSPSSTNGNDAVWLLNQDGSLLLDARNTGAGRVGYLSLTVPDSWSSDQTKTYCLSFAPPAYTLDPSSQPFNAQGLFVYNSPAGKFALHLQTASCWMNTL